MSGPTIAAVEVQFLHAVSDERIVMSFGSMARRSMALVTVRCDDGTMGHGEIWINYPS